MRRTCKRRPWQGGFFLLPNEIFTLGLSAGEIAVYAYLLFFEDRETHLCLASENWRTHRHESQHGKKVHNPVGGQASHRNPANYRMEIGRDCEKRDAALHDPAHS